MRAESITVRFCVCLSVRIRVLLINKPTVLKTGYISQEERATIQGDPSRRLRSAIIICVLINDCQLRYCSKKPEGRPSRSASETLCSQSLCEQESKMGTSHSCTKNTGAVVVIENSEHFLPDPFQVLSDDVIHFILSFVSYAPFELEASEDFDNDEAEHQIKDYNAGTIKLSKLLLKRKTLSPFRTVQQMSYDAFHSSAKDDDFLEVTTPQRFGTLTHVLPLVNRRFRVLCNESNVLWTESLERLVGVSNNMRCRHGQSSLWEKGIVSFTQSFEALPDESFSEGVVNDVSDISDVPLTESERLRAMVANACTCVRQERQSNVESCSASVAQQVLREVYIDYKPVRLPVFIMRYSATLHEAMNIRLYEPRYQIMIEEIMAGRASVERIGFPIAKPRPRFLFSCKSSTWKTKTACVVEVRRCHVHRAGATDIVMTPVEWVLMEDVSIRPESAGLYEATIVRFPKRSTMPVFCMRGNVILGQEIHLRLFEARYRILIREVMAGRSEESGSPPPQFVYAHKSPMKAGNIACVVEVLQCRTQQRGDFSGIADVTVVPRHWVLIEKLKLRPDSGRLFDATILYLESRDSRGMMERRNQGIERN